jgi:hypothetical protein
MEVGFWAGGVRGVVTIVGRAGGIEIARSSSNGLGREYGGPCEGGAEPGCEGQRCGSGYRPGWYVGLGPDGVIARRVEVDIEGVVGVVDYAQGCAGCSGQGCGRYAIAENCCRG